MGIVPRLNDELVTALGIVQAGRSGDLDPVRLLELAELSCDAEDDFTYGAAVELANVAVRTETPEAPGRRRPAGTPPSS